MGEDALYYVFISNRVASDVMHAEKLFNELTTRGLRVFWDKLSLPAGGVWSIYFFFSSLFICCYGSMIFCCQTPVNWESGFCDGKFPVHFLVFAHIFVV